MNRRALVTVLLALWCSSVVGADTSPFEVPAISIEQAIAIAKRHIESEKLNVSGHYLASAEWNPRFGLVSFWRIEWRMKKQVKGGQIIVTVDANGKVEHGFGE